MKGIICFVALFALAATAGAQTSFNYSYTGTGTGGLNAFTLTATTGTISLATGNSTLTITGSSTSSAPITAKVTFANGDTLTASSSSSTLVPIGTTTLLITGNANITGGTGAYAHATGTFTYSLTVTASTSITFTASGSGVISGVGSSTGGGGGTTSTAPSVANKGILNAASDAYVGLPNSSIAQGSIFTIYGTNLGPSSSPALSFPLDPNLGGVTVKVTSGGSTVTAIPMSVGPNQISAVLPGNTTPGSATLTVAYNGQTSAAASFQVVPSSFGIFAQNQAGSGPGIITNTNYQVLGLTSALHPGDEAIIWGTGLGASPGDDGTKPPTQTNLSNLNVSVYVGSTQVTPDYQGRSFFTGEDQINFKIPSGVLGCHVPIAVQIGTIVSNFVTMPIAAAGSNVCSDPTGPTTSDLSQYASQGTVTIGSVGLTRTTSTITLPTLGTQTTTSDGGSASFVKYNYQQLNVASNPFNTYTFGACTVYTFRGSAGGTTDVIQPTYLDAGSAITITGPNGTKQLPKETSTFNGQNTISYFASLGSSSPGPLYLTPGSYSVTGPGASGGVAAFSQNITLPASLTWTNSNISTINRANGQQITWTGGDPTSDVVIEGLSLVLGTAPDGSDSVGALFFCTAPQSALQFTIPPVVLLSLPASGSVNPLVPIPLGSLTVANQVQVKMNVPNVDLAYLSFEASQSVSVTYQ